MSIKKYIVGKPDEDSNRLKIYPTEEEAEKKCKGNWKVILAMNEAASLYKFRNPYKSKAQKR